MTADSNQHEPPPYEPGTMLMPTATDASVAVHYCVIRCLQGQRALLVPIDGLAEFARYDIEVAKQHREHPAQVTVARCSLAFVATMAGDGSWTPIAHLDAEDRLKIEAEVQHAFAFDKPPEPETTTRWRDQVRAFADRHCENRMAAVRDALASSLDAS